MPLPILPPPHEVAELRQYSRFTVGGIQFDNTAGRSLMEDGHMLSRTVIPSAMERPAFAATGTHVIKISEDIRDESQPLAGGGTEPYNSARTVADNPGLTARSHGVSGRADMSLPYQPITADTHRRLTGVALPLTVSRMGHHNRS